MWHKTDIPGKVTMKPQKHDFPYYFRDGPKKFLGDHKFSSDNETKEGPRKAD